uniref:Uncharacterized protein n=1 Tax=Ditylenchus dipsaci TaxID=166011 RepID=A0A915D021_9BILA
MSQHYNRQCSSASNQQNYRRHKVNRRENPRSSDPVIRSQDLSDLPGYSFDVTTGKFYKILSNQPGQPSGSTQKTLIS